MRISFYIFSLLVTSMTAFSLPTPKLVMSLDPMDADEAVVYSSKDANVWEKRAIMDADEAVVYSSVDANVWEKRGIDEDMDADEAVVYSSEDANVWE
ncbi:hypothetical protein MMC19_003515 [Ptychographa xylographoides]|nr:hypothetical protein [Ptychographa xylographoides]